MAAFTSCTPSFQAPRLKYDSSKVEFCQTQSADKEGFMTDLGSHLCDVQGLFAEEGIQLSQDCIMTAAQHTYDTAKASAQPPHKPRNAEKKRKEKRRKEKKRKEKKRKEKKRKEKTTLLSVVELVVDLSFLLAY